MFVQLNPNSGMPIYRQLFDQLRQRIVSGQLAAGEQLPSVRELSAQLKINPLTAAKVFQHLEQDGLVETRRGLGTFVTQGNAMRSKNEKRKMIAPAVNQIVTEALNLKLTEEDVIHLVRQKFKETTDNEGE